MDKNKELDGNEMLRIMSKLFNSMTTEELKNLRKKSDEWSEGYIKQIKMRKTNKKAGG